MNQRHTARSYCQLLQCSIMDHLPNPDHDGDDEYDDMPSLVSSSSSDNLKKPVAKSSTSSWRHPCSPIECDIVADIMNLNEPGFRKNIKIVGNMVAQTNAERRTRGRTLPPFVQRLRQLYDNGYVGSQLFASPHYNVNASSRRHGITMIPAASTVGLFDGTVAHVGGSNLQLTQYLHVVNHTPQDRYFCYTLQRLLEWRREGLDVMPLRVGVTLRGTVRCHPKE
jgi:hypothetical protein